MNEKKFQGGCKHSIKILQLYHFPEVTHKICYLCLLFPFSFILCVETPICLLSWVFVAWGETVASHRECCVLEVQNSQIC